jgi:hypothetical protein
VGLACGWGLLVGGACLWVGLAGGACRWGLPVGQMRG